MPFTVSHAAVVPPLRRLARGGLFAPALAAGSMAPDFSYFSPLGVPWRVSHSLPGLLTWSTPASLVALALYDALLRPGLLALLPSRSWPLAGRALQPGLPRTRRDAALAVPSILLGALTHLLWDSFTHGGGWGVARWPGLLERPVALGPLTRPVYSWAQYACSIAGLAALAGWAWLWARRPGREVVHPRRPLRGRAAAAPAVLAAALLLGLANAAAWAQQGSTTRLVRTAAVGFVVGAISGLLFSVAGVGAWSRLGRPGR
ncbi:MAG: DUF4184 family protein [Acidimicrobiales bacterium]